MDPTPLQQDHRLEMTELGRSGDGNNHANNHGNNRNTGHRNSLGDYIREKHTEDNSNTHGNTANHNGNHASERHERRASNDRPSSPHDVNDRSNPEPANSREKGVYRMKIWHLILIVLASMGAGYGIRGLFQSSDSGEEEGKEEGKEGKQEEGKENSSTDDQGSSKLSKTTRKSKRRFHTDSAVVDSTDLSSLTEQAEKSGSRSQSLVINGNVIDLSEGSSFSDRAQISDSDSASASSSSSSHTKGKHFRHKMRRSNSSNTSNSSTTSNISTLSTISSISKAEVSENASLTANPFLTVNPNGPEAMYFLQDQCPTFEPKDPRYFELKKAVALKKGDGNAPVRLS
jgi:trimeric autotransporter adhesin